MYTKHAELKAGIVVVAALTVLLGLLWLAGGAESLFAKYRSIQIRFQQGARAPVEGDSLNMNGQKIGLVKEVAQKEELRRGAQLTSEDRTILRLKPGEDGTAREIYVLVTARLPASQKIPEGTTAEMTIGVTGDRTLELKPGRSTRDLTDEDTRAHPILASESGSIASIAKQVQILVTKAGDLVDRGGVVLDDVRAVIKSVKDKIDGLDLTGIQGNVLDASASLKETFAIAKARIDEIGQKISDAASDLKVITADGSKLVKAAGGDVDAILKNLREVSLELKGIIERAAPKVDAILDDVGRAARGAADLGKELQGLAPRLHAILGDAGTGIDRVLRQLNEVGHNLADASEDIRAHPWKLLNKPDEKEIAYENLRNAASNYVRAADAQRETAEDLKALMARTDLPPSDLKKLIEAAFARLQADMEKYKEAEQRFTELLRAGPK